ncbi:uncharacterized protein LOC108736899 [Agrilus planipennis]|nr:uncharacterized protein LOC108736899 [Agrilus planipennis]
MVIPKISVTNYTGASLGVDAEFTNMTFYGGKDFVIKNHSQDFDAGECHTVIYIPKINMVTNYRIKGKILILDIDSSGKAEATFSDLVITAKLKMKKYQKNEKEHLKFEKDIFDIDIGKAIIHLNNIFPNNPEISENTNLVINENMDLLMQDIKPIALKTARDILLNLLNRVYETFSFDELWPLE